MHLVYLPGAARDLLWLRYYYERVFPEGARAARERIWATEQLLLDNPHIGRPAHLPGIRRLPLGRTPFFLVYRVTATRIEILRVIDGRSFDSMLDD